MVRNQKEDRTKSDLIKGTFSARLRLLRAVGPAERHGDDSLGLTTPQYDRIFGMLKHLSSLFCWMDQSDPRRQLRYPNYDVRTGIVVKDFDRNADGKGDDREWLEGVDALAAKRRHFDWLMNEYVAEFGPISSPIKAVMQMPISADERRLSIKTVKDNQPGRSEFQGDPDDLRQFDYERDL